MECTQHMRALSVFIRNHRSPTDHRGDFGKTDTADFSVTQMKLERLKGNRPQMLLNFLDHRSSLHRSTITQQPSRSASNALAQPLDWANQATIVAATRRHRYGRGKKQNGAGFHRRPL